MLRCDLSLQWKVASDLRFQAAISEPQTPSLCGNSGNLAPSTQKSLAIAQEGTNVRFSNVHFVLSQIFRLNHLTPPFHAFFPPLLSNPHALSE